MAEKKRKRRGLNLEGDCMPEQALLHRPPRWAPPALCGGAPPASMCAPCMVRAPSALGVFETASLAFCRKR